MIEKKTKREPWKANNNMTPQTKWHDHAQDTIKTAIKHNKLPKYQNHTTSNKHHDSIPWFLVLPRESST